MAQIGLTRGDFTDPKRATGLVSPVPDFDAAVQPGQQRPQARDVDGVLLWDIETQRVQESWGRRSTVIEGVRVPAAQQPVVPAGPISFSDVEVRVTSRKGGTGALSLAWTATGFEPVTENGSKAQSATPEKTQARA